MRDRMDILVGKSQLLLTWMQINGSRETRLHRPHSPTSRRVSVIRWRRRVSEHPPQQEQKGRISSNVPEVNSTHKHGWTRSLLKTPIQSMNDESYHSIMASVCAFTNWPVREYMGALERQQSFFSVNPSFQKETHTIYNISDLPVPRAWPIVGFGE
ncbi:uncharacterized protein CIMG_12466 [Coccidioides immitis RS]|uniref:Uncharacterized protein n=1 Tax=Coccidioides immitis (strain RS) TaxID=246410 RepID=A0A0D8JYA1_COCIM|nr:uncharacterized protein CIMG_12466 [Coccidioides immitis RS]KJF61228.1 hypothetical protein CIMG_12466 [Coccidioides immitis RS]